MHIPVLQKEVLGILDPKSNENFIDATAGFAGHSKDILERIKPNGKVLAVEIDKEVFEKMEKIERLIAVNDSYINLKEVVEKNNFYPVCGILFDLGVSSWDLDESGRGFTFLKDEPLDMRFSMDNDLTAEYILNNYPEKEIERILKEYGEERLAKTIAKRIVSQRPVKTTFELKRLIPKKTKPQRTFQALRIAVNDELNNLQKALNQAEDVLEPGGKIAVISFHSLEDRIVKNFFKNNNKFQILTKKPVRPSREELATNYRSHSAKIRGAVKR
jgi:16S rRNA (cytosine1402-N4)-methyltransferase